MQYFPNHTCQNSNISFLAQLAFWSGCLDWGDRIAQGKRTKLIKDELEQLILHFVKCLQPLNSAAEIQALCEAEIALLEEGYPQSTLNEETAPKKAFAPSPKR